MNICAAPPTPFEDPVVPLPRWGDRSLFPSLEFFAYLAHAAISPASVAQQRAVNRCIVDVARWGAGTFPAYAEQRERLRGGLAELLGTCPEEIALTSGTTRGLIDLAWALPLGPRDEVVLFSGEFPANVLPWTQAAHAAGARVTMLPAPDPRSADFADRVLSGVRQRLDQGARFVAVSAVQFQTGLRMPTESLAALCRQKGGHLLVDGIQGVGAMPICPAAEGLSALAGGAHKWLLGSEGAGYLFISRELRSELQPRTAGWLSVQEGARFLFEGKGLLRYDLPLKKDADVFEGGTAALLPFVALEAGVDSLRKLGASEMFSHTQAYHDAIEPALAELGLRSVRAAHKQYRSGILSFLPSEEISLKHLSAALRSRGVMISTPDGYLRLAPHFYSSISEVDDVVAAFREALEEVRGV